jgi:RNA polymerase sigma factor (sigma-70 family)
MSRNLSPSSDSSIGKNLPLFNDDIIRSISETVRFTLLKNASSWVKKGYIDVDDFIQSANLHILNRSTSFNPDHGTPFKAWVCVVARNYTISEAKKLKRIITAKTRFDVIDGMDLEDFSILEPFQKKEDTSESKDRLALLTAFLSTLNESDKLLLEMMKDGLSKEEMMEITHKTGGNIDTCKSRLRQKILRYVKTLYK